MKADGRIVDPENGNITHSESQAYGLLLSLFADEPVTFEQIWNFTKNHMLRADNLFAWRYTPGHGITDNNNATDADLIISSTLALAGRRWNRGDYLEQAIRTSEAIGKKLIRHHRGQLLLMPAEKGFGTRSQADGPVLNLSYYVFSALHISEALTPQYDWDSVSRSGFDLINRSLRNGTLTDWTSAEDPRHPKTARDVGPREFGYNAIRVGLNLLLLDGPERDQALELFYRNNSPYLTRRSPNGHSLGALKDPGYQALAETIRCDLTGQPVDMNLFNYTPTTYYASAIHLMMFAVLYRRHPECLPGMS
ncbi:hypothetical protein JCR33_12640 [Acuticoccus sp. 2012]|uniref:cellulase n=2 Tax=Acuticoccus mangrovi TaxID=2796142 RepID=A0A934MHX0_9HYPH|nr:hypothetical protein [Acuticoccus mangrovi]